MEANPVMFCREHPGILDDATAAGSGLRSQAGWQQ